MSEPAHTTGPAFFNSFDQAKLAAILARVENHSPVENALEQSTIRVTSKTLSTPSSQQRTGSRSADEGHRTLVSAIPLNVKEEIVSASRVTPAQLPKQMSATVKRASYGNVGYTTTSLSFEERKVYLASLSVGDEFGEALVMEVVEMGARIELTPGAPHLAFLPNNLLGSSPEVRNELLNMLSPEVEDGSRPNIGVVVRVVEPGYGKGEDGRPKKLSLIVSPSRDTHRMVERSLLSGYQTGDKFTGILINDARGVVRINGVRVLVILRGAGVRGALHISQVGGSQSELINAAREGHFRVLGVDLEKRRLNLTTEKRYNTLRSLQESARTGASLNGWIKGVKDGMIFVELAGLVVKVPAGEHRVAVGQKQVKVVVREVDFERGTISLRLD